jgi:hypothetical protein
MQSIPAAARNDLPRNSFACLLSGLLTLVADEPASARLGLPKTDPGSRYFVVTRALLPSVARQGSSPAQRRRRARRGR